LDREFIGRINVLLVGLGKWSSNYSSSIKNNKSCKLSSHLGARDLIQKLDLDKNFFLKILENLKIDIVILSTKPSYQKRILGSLDGFQGQIILEKPLINNRDDIKFFENLSYNLRKKIIVNHFHFFSNHFLNLLESVKVSDVNKLHIRDYGYGPFRNYISPLLDWGPHALGVCHYLNSNIKVISAKKIAEENTEKWYLNLGGDRIKEIKILTGNGFKSKKRSMIFYSGEKKFFEYDNSESLDIESPMDNLLNEAISQLGGDFSNEKKIHRTFSIALQSSITLLDIESQY
tara:strand:- start:427 stop:1293 length:867 start_codon:yes stop_codon:yes gene_type:complete